MLLELALAEAEELGLKGHIAALEQPRTRSVAELLDPFEAETRLRRKLAYWEEMGDESGRSYAAAMLAHVLCAQERYDEAESYAAIGQSAGAPDDYDSQSLALAALAKVLAHRKDLERAESSAREAVAIAGRTDDIDASAWLRTDLAEVLSLAEKTEEARAAVEDALRLAEQKEDLILVELARARLAELQTSASRISPKPSRR
jgi:tetratricopeptide (TPR) repeat protein